MRQIRTDAIVRIAYSDRLNVRIFKHSKQEYHIKGPDITYLYPTNRYMLHVPDAFYSPAHRFVMDRSTKSIIANDMILDEVTPFLEGFGDVVERYSDGRILIDFQNSGITVTGPAICVSPWKVFSNQILHVLMGIVHCDDLLGEEVPILVPEDLSEREQRNLALFGVGQERCIPVPRNSVTQVTDAFVPSKSFTRSSFLGTDPIDHGYFFERSDLKAYAKRIIENLPVASSTAAKNPPARLLYISRKDANARYTLNEDEAVEALRPLGVRRVRPMELTISEMAHAIHQADVVIAAFRSEILNFCAARPGTTLIEIDHPAQEWCGRRICEVLGHRHAICTRYGGPRNHGDRSDVHVNIAELVNLASEALERVSRS